MRKSKFSAFDVLFDIETRFELSQLIIHYIFVIVCQIYCYFILNER